MDISNTPANRRSWKLILGSLAMVFGAGYAVALAMAFNPDRSIADAVRANERYGEYLFADMPTTGRVLRVERRAPQWVLRYAGIVDLKKLRSWSKLPEAGQPAELPQGWDPEFGDALAELALPEYFADGGDPVIEWSALEGDIAHLLRINMRNGNFVIVSSYAY